MTKLHVRLDQLQDLNSHPDRSGMKEAFPPYHLSRCLFIHLPTTCLGQMGRFMTQPDSWIRDGTLDTHNARQGCCQCTYQGQGAARLLGKFPVRFWMRCSRCCMCRAGPHATARQKSHHSCARSLAACVPAFLLPAVVQQRTRAAATALQSRCLLSVLLSDWPCTVLGCGTRAHVLHHTSSTCPTESSWQAMSVTSRNWPVKLQ